ncbi:MAG: outer membrane lipoprotein LolB [Hahellaceae bacterium]|jgi:outer membrane lipoprotein LolB|nr:outer membrane lipoprotein LolB [Hahellaceae bacterium]MCP5212440.1 outer membrane lipoprotein LolB [Hahellaceae bacterium]
MSGCATKPEYNLAVDKTPPPQWEVRRAQLYTLTSWRIIGKIGVKQPDQNDSAVINRWQQIEDNFIIDLSSSILGMGATQLVGNPEMLQISKSDGETIVSDTPESLLYQQLGWSLPLKQLPFWIKGVPSPKFTQSVMFTEQGDPAKFRESGWSIDASRFDTTGDFRLPGKIKLTNGDVTIIVIINEWHLDDA